MSETETGRLSDRVRPNSEAAPWVVDSIKRLESELDRLRAENEALRADAARYRWLRDEATEGEWQELSRTPGGITESMIDQWMKPAPHSK